MTHRRAHRTPLALAALCAATAALLLTAAPALAAKKHLLTSFFAASAPRLLAVNQSTGDVYVPEEAGGGAVHVFKANGEPAESAALTGASFNVPYGVAVDNSTEPTAGDVYVGDLQAVRQFSPAGVFTGLEITSANVEAGKAGSDGSFEPTGPAVDSHGNVYVPDYANNVIDEFSSAGAFIKQFGEGQLTNPLQVAVDASGNVYVVNNNGPNGLVEFDSSGACVNACASVDSNDSVSVALDASGNVYAQDGQRPATITEYPPSGGTSIEQFGSGDIPFGFGVAINSTGAGGVPVATVYVSDAGENDVHVFSLAELLTLTVATTGTGSGELTSSPVGIQCGATCTGEFAEGGTVTLTATRSTHSKFTGWEGCPHVISSNEYVASECEVAMTEAKTVKAGFAAIPQASLEVSVEGSGEVTSSPPGIACTSGSCTEHFDIEGPENTVTLTAAPADERTAINKWTGCTRESGLTCEVEMTAAKTVKAVFAPIAQEELKVQAAGEGAVTGSSPGSEFTPIDCGSTCEAQYNEGASITLTATPSPDNHFEKWEGCESPSGSECTLTMTAAKTVKAIFAPTFHTLTATPNGPGSLSAPTGITGCEQGGHGTCAGSYQEGSIVVLTADPGVHHHVAWNGCTPKADPDECELTIGASDEAVQIEFPINEHTLTVSRTGLGSVSASSGMISSCSPTGGTCEGTYDEASTILLTATPAAHHRVAWTGCAREPSADTCEVTIGPSDETLHVAFPGITQTLTVLPAGQGSVRATSGPISHCSAAGGTCTGHYIETATAILIATPGSGQAVTWEGCTAVPSPNTCEVEIGASETAVKATFAPITHSLTIAKAGSGQGSVTCNGAPCASTYPEATALTLTAVPAPGSTFAGWSGAGCSGTGACRLTLESDATLTATFTANLPPTPTEEKCVVPELVGKALAQVRSALNAAHCTLGKVTKPKPKKGRKPRPLVVKSSSPSVGTTLSAGGTVNLDLGLKTRKQS